MPGILYIVPTPVGNLEDMTFRAIRVLKEADLILAEDTRTSSVLLKHYEIKGRLESHHKFNEHKTAAIIKERILAGLNVVLISDAGTPGISDPGTFWSGHVFRKALKYRLFRERRHLFPHWFLPDTHATDSVLKVSFLKRRDVRQGFPNFRKRQGR